MAAGIQIGVWNGISRRRVPRFTMAAPLDVVVLRSGIPDTVPGRSVDLCERGIAAVLAGDLAPGEHVGVEVRLSAEAQPLRTRAMVRYQERLKCGLEFTAITPDQRSVIREWAKQAQATPSAAVDLGKSSGKPAGTGSSEATRAGPKKPAAPARRAGNGGRKPHQRRAIWIAALAVLIVAAVLFLWKWNHDWAALESGINPQSGAQSAVQVPTDAMQKLLVHQVDPAYPLEARRQNLRAVIALHIVVGRDGSVLSVRPLNGPDVLAQAAVDALRWWKFQPYLVDGKAVIAETNLAVEFKP
ncbi:MAG: TonB family protein [Candidatus Sulfotelmatobacter sp.]